MEEEKLLDRVQAVGIPSIIFILATIQEHDLKSELACINNSSSLSQFDVKIFEIGRVSPEAHQRFPAAILQPRTKDVLRGSVHQVPVVDRKQIAQVERINLPLHRRGRPLKPRHEDEQCDLTVFVDPGAQQAFDLSDGQVRISARQAAQCGNANPHELVALAVFTGAGFEETL